MRISDWSSDVCSSDLPARAPPTPRPPCRDRAPAGRRCRYRGQRRCGAAARSRAPRSSPPPRRRNARAAPRAIPWSPGRAAGCADRRGRYAPSPRASRADRKSGVEGKGVSVRVDLGGGRTIKKKKIKKTQNKINSEVEKEIQE